MSEPPSSDPVTPSGSNNGGYRTAGIRTEKSQKSRDAAIKSIKEAWGVSEFIDIFPANIKPTGQLGDSAIYNLRQVSRKVPDLAKARALMTSACVSSIGDPIPLSFSCTALIIARLKEQEAIEEAKKKNKDGEKSQGEQKAPGSSKNVAIPVSLENQKSVPAKGSAGKKASQGFINPMDASNPVAGREPIPRNGSAPGQNAVPAKPSVPGNPSRLGKVKAPIPTSRLRQPTKVSAQKLAYTSLTGGKHDGKEVTSGLHVPSAKDKAPFKGSKPVVGKGPTPGKRSTLSSKVDSAIEKPSPKKRVSFASEAEIIGSDLFVSEESDSAESISGVRFVTDEKGVSTDLNAGESKTSAKRMSDGAEEPVFKKLKFNRETLLEELKFVKRPSPQKVGQLGSAECASEAETEIDESLAKSSRDVSKKYTFGEGSQTKDDGDDGSLKQGGDATKVRDAIAARDTKGGHAFLDGRSVNQPKHLKQAKEVLAHTGMAATLRDTEKKMKMKASGNDKASPASPKNSPDREEHIHSTTGRRLSDLHDSKRVKTTGNLSPSNKVHTKLTSNPTTKPSDPSTKTTQKFSISKKNSMDSNGTDVFDKTEKRSDKSTTEDDLQLTPKAVVTPARGNTFAGPSVARSKPNSILPKVPEILTARVPADRALIISIPGIIKAYVKELQAAIPDGVAPDGDLLSMIIVNKYGYFLEHVDKLDKDLKSLYYEAIDKDEEMDRKELEEKEREEKEKERKGKGRNL